MTPDEYRRLASQEGIRLLGHVFGLGIVGGLGLLGLLLWWLT